MEIIIVAVLSMLVGVGVTLTAKYDSEDEKKKFRGEQGVIEAPEEDRQLISTVVKQKPTRFEISKQMVIEERSDPENDFKKTALLALEYIERGEEVNWSEVLKSRMSDERFFSSSLFVVVDSVLDESMDSFSTAEQKELMEIFVSHWIKGVQSKVELVSMENEVLDNAGKVPAPVDAPSAESASPQVEWEQLYADLIPPEEKTSNFSLSEQKGV